MESLNNLPTFFTEFQTRTMQLRKLIPSLNESIITSLRSQSAIPRDRPDEEVFAGLPTLQNTLPLFDILSNCPPPPGSTCSFESTKIPARRLLSRLELVAILASVYEL
ncbi:unnamed protein product, partial [Mesocestoides corti]|uniref:Uncharacterized protein n=1 Tax=Mesocestoides corti TaxID=53468 RepID=A0A0R3UNY8_MESCO